MNPRWMIRILILLVAFAAVVPAQQTQFQFQLRVTQGKNTFLIPNASSLTFSALVGQSQTVEVVGTYTGAGKVTLLAPSPNIFASADFSASAKDSQPIVLGPGNTVAFTVTYTPTSGAQSTGQLFLPFIETLPPATGSTTPTQVQNAIVLTLQGTAPGFTLSYVLPADQNVVPLSSGATIPIPATPVNTTGQVALNITNTGSGTGTITGVSISGAAFRLSHLPLFPVIVPAGQNVQLLILYLPTQVASDTGQIVVTFDTGPPVTVNLQGSGTSSAFVYQSLQTSPPTTVSPGETLSFAGTNIGQTSSIAFRVLNAGNSTGTINSINVAGQGFQLSNVPALPQTLAPNTSLTFTITFAPTLANTFKGSLLINSDTVSLSGIGLGTQLAFSYNVAGSTITLGGANNSVIFSPLTIGQSSRLNLNVKNTGTLAATISNIGVGQVNGPFVVSGVPALPLSLAPNEEFPLTITFTPTVLGFSNGTLLFDNTSVALVGSGTQPPSLPAYTISGASGTVAPGSQMLISLNLASPYSVAIAGTLNLNVSGDLTADPAVQFSTGGLTVPFVIPANTTSAVFGNQGTQIGLQAGTVASTITLTPTFATRGGNVDLTPTNPATLKIAVAPAPPTLISIQLSGQTANTVTISLSGFTTTRKLTTGTIQFTTAPGFSMPTSKFTIDLQPIATVWFRSIASQPFGGQFTISIPFTFQGTVPTGKTLLNSIASVSATLSNEVGTSTLVQANVQ